MDLNSLELKRDYRSGKDNILSDFIRPCLKISNEYWRAVGYFSSSALEVFGDPLGEFVRNDGKIRLISSVELVDEDLQAIKRGTSKQEISNLRIEQIIDEEFREGIGDGVSRLLSLLKLNRLEIKIAIPRSGRGIYHEKLGIFFDQNRNMICFSGSANESKTALTGNYESIDVYTSERDPERTQDKFEYFNLLWEDDDLGAQVFSISEAVKRKLIRAYDRKIIEQKSEPENKWRHQEEAVEVFLTRKRGVLEMATGTGKTRTSFKILKRLNDERLIDTVIVSTDGNDLLDQWYDQILKVRLELGGKFRIFRHYRDHKEQLDFNLNPKNAILICSRANVHKALQRLSKGEAERALLIHDEVHGLGSPSNRETLSGLSDDITYRLGLSATPEREYDEEGNDFIEGHIGPVIFSFGLKEAIERGILAPFNYFPLEYQITDEDKLRIRNLFAIQAARTKEGNPMPNEELWQKIAFVYKTSDAKKDVFETFIRQHTSLLERCIIFVETMEYGEDVLDIIHEFRPDFHTYYSGDDSQTLVRFAKGDLECLLTCHKLSEGIDIQSLKNVILFSSSRARLETIQRIGRCIRVDPNDPEKVANIIDFIRRSDQDDPDGTKNTDQERADWLSELSEVRQLEN